MSSGIQENSVFKLATKQTGVWSNDMPVKSKSVTSESKSNHSVEENDEIVVIDDDELYDDSDLYSVASRFRNNHTPFENIQSNLSKLSSLNAWTDINLGLLLSKFNLENDVKEEDVCWIWDSLFLEVTSEITKDRTVKL